MNADVLVSVAGRPAWVPQDERYRYLLEGLIQVDLQGVTLPTGWCKGGVLLAMVAIQHGKTGRDAEVGSVIFLDPDDERHVAIFEMDGRPGFIFQTNSTNLFCLGVETSVRLVSFNLATGKCEVKTEVPLPADALRSGEIVNDSIVRGSWAIVGTKNTIALGSGGTGGAGEYFWRAGSSTMTPLCWDQTCSNGKYIVPDGKSLILGDIDSPTCVVMERRFDPAKPELGPAEDFVDMTKQKGVLVPDGQVLTPDMASIVVATFNYSATTEKPGYVHMFSRTGPHRGAPQQSWHFPCSPRMTTVALVKRPDKKECELYALSADEGMDPKVRAYNFNSGILWVAPTSIVGDPPRDIMTLG